MRRALFLTILFAFVAVPCWAQYNKNCSPVGTWYGGTEGKTIKYMAFISPLEGNRFSIVWDGAYSMDGVGFPVATKIYGEFGLEKHQEFQWAGTAIGMANPSTSLPPAKFPALIGVHYRVRLDGCTTLIVVHDLFGGWWWESNKTPFADPPDFVPAPPPIVEIYKRLPATCPACNQ